MKNGIKYDEGKTGWIFQWNLSGKSGGFSQFKVTIIGNYIR